MIGTMNWKSTRMKGTFECPQCEGATEFRLRESRPFLTFYLIPIIPIGGLEVYVQCGKCKEAFEPSVLSVSSPPELVSGRPRSYEDDLLTSIALMLNADAIGEPNIWIAQRVYWRLTNQSLSRSRLGSECSQIRSSRMSMSSFLATAAERLDFDERLSVASALFAVAAVEGKLSPMRSKILQRLPAILAVDEGAFRESVEEAVELI